jgi:hypothetical protein
MPLQSGEPAVFMLTLG